MANLGKDQLPVIFESDFLEILKKVLLFTEKSTRENVRIIFRH